MEQGTPQYTQDSIARYEVIFGRDFVSTGGIETTRWLVASLGLKPGMRVLDAGCGLGGSAFYLAREFAAEVLGVDLLPQMIRSAKMRAGEYGLAGVKFVEGDLLEYVLPAGHFDLVYSRDAFLHIADKAALFHRLYECLRPGGTLFFTDYACGPTPHGEEFTAYRRGNAYDLHEVAAYGRLVEQAGFVAVEAKDHTEEFVRILQAEMARASCAGGVLSETDRAYLLERWARKIEFCRAGDMRWCSVRALRQL